jgi:hypothetical protein
MYLFVKMAYGKNDHVPLLNLNTATDLQRKHFPTVDGDMMSTAAFNTRASPTGAVYIHALYLRCSAQ